MMQRRDFLKQTGAAGAATLTLGSLPAWALTTPPKKFAARGYAARDKSGQLSPWTFERRPLGDEDILLDVKFCGVCHSDIHTVRGDWGPQQYPLVPGHEIAGVVAAVGKNVKKFKVGDHAGVGCMVDSCGTCASCTHGQEQYCDNHATVFTYGSPDQQSGGVTQGGYATNLVVKQHFAVQIPKGMALQAAAPLLCAGVTTYSPLLRAQLRPGLKVGVAGIGGLGHLAIQLAKAQGADVYAFTTSPGKVADLKGFGAKEVIVVDSSDKLKPYNGQLDYLISTIPALYDLGAYVALVKPYGQYIQVGMPAKDLSFNNLAFITSRVNYSGSMIGGMAETQQVLDFCAAHHIAPSVQVIAAKDLNEVYEKVVNKEARYRYVIDVATI